MRSALQRWGKLRHLSPVERQKQRRQWIIDEFFSWAANLHILPQSKLGEAVGYLLKYKEGFCTFLTDGRLETTNNRTERAVKVLMIGRKNCLFSKSEKIPCLLVRTNPNLPSVTKTTLAVYLPWNQKVQADCRANY